VILGLACRGHGAPLDAPADPLSDYPARPEWYNLALFQLLHLLTGPLEILATVVLPGIFGLYLFALPLLDRKEGNALAPRIKFLAPLALAAIAVGGLTFMSMQADAKDDKLVASVAKAKARAARANEIAKEGVPPDGPLAMAARDPVLGGGAVFEAKCSSCHLLGAMGDPKKATAPVLDGFGTEAWVSAMLRNPDDEKHFGRTVYKGTMPSMTTCPADQPKCKPMSDADVRATAAFLASQADEAGEAIPPGAARTDAALVRAGETIVKQRCTSCHLLNGEGDDNGDGTAPELAHWGSLAWTESQISDPTGKSTYRDKAVDGDTKDSKGHMPKFAGDINPSDIDVVAKFVRGRARGAY
jgi:ubiquinol-cytochrome c reductase cytochrome b subunit